MAITRTALLSVTAALSLVAAGQTRAQTADEEALKNAIRAETEAYYARNADAWQATWVQDSTAMRTMVQNGGFNVSAGWEKFGAPTAKEIKQSPTPVPIQLQASNYRIRTGGDLAWVEYDQRIVLPNDTVPYVSREQRALVRKDGQWKIMSALTEDLASFGSTPRAIENQLNATGYNLLAAKRVNDAIEVLKLNVKLFPSSFNTYDSLGEAYAAAGDTKLAIANYQRSVELNPKNENGKAALAKLRGTASK